MLGGGTFLVQNKVLPGAYINFVSASKASATLSERGYVCMPYELGWGAENKMIKVENSEFQKNCFAIFGYDYTSDEMKPFRDLFINAKTLYGYRLVNAGVKAANTYATAKYSGIRGNDITIVIEVNADDESKYDVKTLVGTTQIDTQTVSSATGLISNEFVDFKTSAVLSATAGSPLTGGTNGSAVTGTEYQAFLSAAESYSFNILVCPSVTDVIKSLFIAYTKRLRDENGVKFQCVIHNAVTPDYEGVINVKNTVEGTNAASLVYWVAGTEAGCAVNKSVTNTLYNGEYAINAEYTQTQLETAIEDGFLVFHKVGGEIRVLRDINSFVSFVDGKGEDFSSNQVIRVLDQIGNDIALLFNTRYLGKVPNDAAGRISLWNDIVSYNRQLETLRAIENFDSEELTVEQGTSKNSVVVANPVTPVMAMEKLYMTVYVK